MNLCYSFSWVWIIQYLMVWTLDNGALLYRTQAKYATGILNYFEKLE